MYTGWSIPGYMSPYVHLVEYTRVYASLCTPGLYYPGIYHPVLLPGTPTLCTALLVVHASTDRAGWQEPGLNGRKEPG